MVNASCFKTQIDFFFLAQLHEASFQVKLAQRKEFNNCVMTDMSVEAGV